MNHLLIVEDNNGLANVLHDTFVHGGYQVTLADNGETAIRLLREGHFDAILTDLKLPKKDGMEVLACARAESPSTPIILMTAYAEVETAVKALKMGAADYLIKPFSTHEIEIILEKCLYHKNLERENQILRQELKTATPLFIGSSPAMKKIFDTIDRVARTDAGVLITGQSGTGKELVATRIHEVSARRAHPLVKINCASIPETLLESELFGHEKGSFTGAESQRIGKFEAANRGTIFLDEIAEMGVPMQAKILRVLQESTFERVGGNRTLKVDVRVIAATNKNLVEATNQGRFREDLFYRLNVIPIHLPPLRDRREDILPLIDHFNRTLCEKLGRSRVQFDPETIDALTEYPWPGNVRELRNVIERILVLSRGDRISILDLPVDIVESLPGRDDGPPLPELGDGQGLMEQLETIEKSLIETAYKLCHGVQVKTAEKLKIKRTALQYKLKKYGIEK